MFTRNGPHPAVLITGASGGVGYAVAKAFALKGAKLGLIGRSEAKLDQVVKDLNHPHLIAIATDVSNFEEVSGAIQKIVSQIGPIEILINCAGIGAFGSFKNTDIEQFNHIMRINYFGTLNTMKAVLPAMLQVHKGYIVNVASIAGRIGVPFEAAYSASKFAVIGLTEAVHCELRSQGIQVSVITPGPIDTDYFAARGHPYPFKIPAPMKPDKVVRAIFFLIEHKRMEKMIPRWLGWAYVIRILFPTLYRMRMNKMYSVFLKDDDIHMER